MKTLSITEPFATLIKDGLKRIETRSFKTNYRGELYIHASSTKIAKKNREDKELMNLLKDNSLNYGNIICKCKLTDCVYMTKEFVENLKKNNYQEYICGDYKEGRYAWILEEIEPLDYPIKAKGQLNIWNYYNELEVMKIMDDVEYGWVDEYNNKYYEFGESFSDKYRLQSPKKIIENKIGVCWDQVELERYYFKNNDWNIKTFFLVHYDDDKCPTHTFLTFEKSNKYYWFEHSWNRFKGIHEYNTMRDLLLEVKEKFIKYELNNNYNKDNLILREYNKPKTGLSTLEFYKHCEKGKIIL